MGESVGSTIPILEKSAVDTLHVSKKLLATASLTFALPTICNFAWIAASGLSISTILSFGATVIGMFFSPMLLISVAAGLTAYALHRAEQMGLTLFYTAEAYGDFTAFVNSEMKPIYDTAIKQAKKPEDAIDLIAAELKTNANDKYIKACNQWIAINSEKYSKECKALKKLLESLNDEHAKAATATMVDKMVEQEKIVLKEG